MQEKDTKRQTEETLTKMKAIISWSMVSAQKDRLKKNDDPLRDARTSLKKNDVYAYYLGKGIGTNIIVYDNSFKKPSIFKNYTSFVIYVEFPLF